MAKTGRSCPRNKRNAVPLQDYLVSVPIRGIQEWLVRARTLEEALQKAEQGRCRKNLGLSYVYSFAEVSVNGRKLSCGEEKPARKLPEEALTQGKAVPDLPVAERSSAKKPATARTGRG